MSTKNVLWLSDSCLPCSCQGTVNVFVLLKTGEIIPAQLVATTGGPSCSKAKYQYNIAYDTLELPDGYTVLSSLNIDGVICEGVFTAFVQNYALNNLIDFIPYGSYTPTLYDEDNIDSSTSATFTFFKIGDIVTVDGTVVVDPTLTATLTQLGISLPPDFPSIFSSNDQLSGQAVANQGAQESGGLYADPTNNRALLQWICEATDAFTFNVHFAYQVIAA